MEDGGMPLAIGIIIGAAILGALILGGLVVAAVVGL
jgi:hypothetical protein